MSPGSVWCRARQLRQLHYDESEAGKRLARMDLARLVEWRVMARLDRSIGGVRAGSEGFVFRLDAAGQRLIPSRAAAVPATVDSIASAHPARVKRQ